MSRLIAILLLAATPALAQQPATPAPTSGQAPGQAPPAARPPQGPQRPQVQSPVVEGDKATFAIYAPKASEVKLVERRDRSSRRRAEQGVHQGRERRVDADRVAAAAGDLRVRLRRRRRLDGRPVEPERRRQRPRRARHRGSARPRRLAPPRRVAPDGARQRDHALVRLEGDRHAPPRPRLHAARLQRVDEEVSGALPAARRRRQRRALGGPRPRQRHRRQPARRRQDDADGDRDDRRPCLPAAAGRAGWTREGAEDVRGRPARRRRAARREGLSRRDQPRSPRHRRAVDGRRSDRSTSASATPIASPGLARSARPPAASTPR